MSSLEDCKRKLANIRFDIKDCELRLDMIKNNEERCRYQGQELDEGKQKERYDLHGRLADYQEELKFYEEHSEYLFAASSRISALPHVFESGAQEFAQALARKLRQCYDNGDLESPMREDRADPCFHSDIEYALVKLKEDGGRPAAFAECWQFVREHKPGYGNLCDPLGRNTNPDFVSTTRGPHGYFVIEAKLDKLCNNKTKRDRYKGQQAGYLSGDCQGVILLAYEERCTSSDLRQQLCTELEGVFDMRAVAVGVVKTIGAEELPRADDDGVLSGDEFDDVESLLSDGEEHLPPEVLAPVHMSEDVLRPEALDGDRRLWDLWHSIKGERPEDGHVRILDRCFFDVPLYMLQIRTHLCDKRQWLKEGESIPEMLAGGSTQMGKTMFVVIGVCVAKKLEAASVVITHKVAGRNSLASKIQRALALLNKADRLGQLDPRCMAYAEKGKTEANRSMMLENNDCIVISDTAAQIAEARGSMYRILSNLQREGDSKGRFILFKDEADCMLRTYDRRLRLEESIDKLTPSAGSYRGAQLIINISATLMPVFLEMARTGARPRGPVFLTSVPPSVSDTYSGVANFFPLKSVNPDLHLDADAAPEDARPIFLDPRLSRDPDSLGINQQVEHLFEDACRADSTKKKALLLDISLTRVYAAGNIFDKAEQMQAKYSNLHVVVYCGRGVVVRAAKDFDHNDDGIDVHSASRRGMVLLPAWKQWIDPPDAGQNGGAWYTTAKDDWGRDGEALRSTIGPGKKIRTGARLARVDEVLNALECALGAAGRGDEPIAVFGYTMMARGESFVTDQRVPSHLVLFMTAGASFDLLVQTAGRATFLRRDLLADNGWVDEQKQPVVRVLMPEQDYKVIQSYPKLIKHVDEHVRRNNPLQELFGDGSVLQDIALLQDFADSPRHGFGDKRKRYPTAWMGGDDDLPGSSETLAGLLQRLALPKKSETIWYDFSAERVWYQCKVMQVRFKIEATEPFDNQDVEYLLKCTDRSIVSLDDWVFLEVDDSNWTRRKQDILEIHATANIHEPWILQDMDKIRKVVQELLKEHRGSWLTAKGIEDQLLAMVSAGRLLGGLAGEDLRHCMDKEGLLPGSVLQNLSERARPMVLRRPRTQPLLDYSATVQRRDGMRGAVHDITLPPSSTGPTIQLEDGTTQVASDFTDRRRAWPAHLSIVEQPIDNPLSTPVSYESFVGSSKQSFDAGEPAPEGLFEYSYTTASVLARRAWSPPAAAGTSEGPSSLHDSPVCSRGSGASRPTPHELGLEYGANASEICADNMAHDVADSPRRTCKRGAVSEESSSRLSSRKREKRANAATALAGMARRVGQTAPIDLTGDATTLTPNDMRVLIDNIGTVWPTLLKLLEKGRALSQGELAKANREFTRKGVDEDDVPPDLRRRCIDSCEETAAPRLEWAHLYALPRAHLEQLCHNAGVIEDAMPTRDMGEAIGKEIVRRRIDTFGN